MKPTRAVLILTLLPLAAVAAEWGELEHEFEADKPWVEVAAKLPPAPLATNLHEFAVSAIAPHRYFIDGASISVGADKVVRYSVVVQTEGGSRNVSFEGLRCETAERRLYAFGQPDGSWSRARDSGWQGIALRSGHDYRKALYEDIFCRDDLRIRDAAAALANLKRQAR